ncbi:MAG: hypothetical protein AB1546_02295 [bacterium]
MRYSVAPLESGLVVRISGFGFLFLSLPELQTTNPELRFLLRNRNRSFHLTF